MTTQTNFYFHTNSMIIRDAMQAAGLAPATYSRFPNDRSWCESPGYVLQVLRTGMTGGQVTSFYTHPSMGDQPENIEVWYDAPQLASSQYLGRLSDYFDRIRVSSVQ